MAMAEMEDVPLVSEEKIPSNRRRLMMVVGAITFLMAMTLSITLGYVYFHKQHFRIRAGDPSHTKVGFPNQKDVQKLLELLQECHAFRQFSWQVAPKNLFSSFRMIPVISDTAQHVPVWSWCSPVQETYPDPQIVFNELKSLNVDNSDPENIKSHRKTGALVALGILPYYFMPWEQVSDTFRSHFSAKPAGVSGIIQSQSHDMSQHESTPVSNLLANFLSLRKPSNVTQKSQQLRSRRLQGLCDGLCDVIKNIQRWIRMHSRLLC